MSHTTKINTVAIKDEKALERTVADLNKLGVECELVKDARPRMYFGHQEVQCAFVLKLKNAKCQHTGKHYDVGFVREKDGTLSPIFDEYGNGIASQLGFNVNEKGITPEERAKRTIGKLLQNYAGNAAVNKAKQQGYTINSRKVTADGTLHVRLGVPG